MALLLRLIILLWPALLVGCNSVYFLPMKPWVQNPANQGLLYEDVVLIHPRGERVHGWWLPAKGAARGTVYFLHGNAQNVSTHVMNVIWLPEQGFNVFLPDYRGYGLSDGEPKIKYAMQDIQLGLDWLRSSGRLGDKPLIVFAQSLGASLTIPVLAKEGNYGRYDCLMIEAAFTGYGDIVGDILARNWLLRVLKPVVIPFQPQKYDAIDAIGYLRAPLLVLHSEEDEVIPFSHGEALYAQATTTKEFQRLRGRHIASLRDPDVRNRLIRFTEEYCGVRRQPLRQATPDSSKRSPEPPAADLLRPPGNGLTF
ncbi:alpha/beta hydrolase [Alcanivorax sp. 1008]|uniref:alpha/beta hydrolase n=1 Tax=Alcanivorax sp. 1008 TaxID=2816853 RepID=UPI001D2B34ED|nr:alpha/beta fold hydrolase [Alcanivorax sp. 1008]MCC1495783.1 alpha/beta fold hydrolase [Alcanivorax sp. 1008]